MHPTASNNVKITNHTDGAISSLPRNLAILRGLPRLSAES
jgi:hypothetical protein